MSEMTEVVRARDLHAGDAVLVGHDLFEIVERRYTRGGHVWITTEGHHYPFCVPITERMRVRAFEPAGIADTETPRGRFRILNHVESECEHDWQEAPFSDPEMHPVDVCSRCGVLRVTPAAGYSKET